ncbi:MAG: hypothetical protein ACK4Z0_01580 [Sphingomonadaceae bacterium]
MAPPRERDHTNEGTSPVLNILSLLIGLAAGAIAVFGLIPFVGWANWFVVPIALFGLVLGLVSRRKEGQILNIVVIAIALVRLSLGGGLI